ncbi:MAG: ComEC/Rec2 family competence protein [Candidatus Limnocylindria bacterium]
MAGLALPVVLAGTAVGVLAADAGWQPAAPALIAAAAILVAAGVMLRRPAVVGCGVLLLGLAVGEWRGVASALPTGPDSLSALTGEASWQITGTVVDDPRPRGERQQVVLEAVVLRASREADLPVSGRLLVWLPRSAATGAGDRIAFDGRLQEPRDFDGFAYREYLARQGIGASSSAFRMEVVGRQAGPLPALLGGLRAGLLHGLNATVPEPEAALGAGILLGVRAGIAPEVSDAFARAGLTHVVAISGWNIAIVAAVAAAATRPLIARRGGRWLALAAAFSVVGGYVLLTGASPSVVRAALMAAALVLARVGGSRAHAASALMAAALAMLVAAPPVLWDVGFQLSALATGGLIWFAAPMERRLRRWPALVREPVALTMAAQLTTLPVILLNFERLSLVAPAANVVVVPLVPVVMLSSALAATAGALDALVHVPVLGDAVAWASGGAAWLYLRVMIMAGVAAAAVPFASIDLGAPAWLAAIWYPALALAARRTGHPADGGTAEAVAVDSMVVRLASPRPLAAATLLLLGILTLLTRPDGRLHLLILDVGQGDAIAIVAPSGAVALVDGGPDPDLAMRRLGEVLPFWQRRLEMVILTHPHEDHVAGLLPALERFRVRLVLEPGRGYDNPTYPRFQELALREPGGRLGLARAGRRLMLDHATDLTVLFPSEADADASLPDGDINNASVVLLLEHAGFRALLTGDAEAPVEEQLLARGLIGPVDVLKVGHHGSNSSTTEGLLDAALPGLAVISSGTGNEYGHPHAVTLGHLAALPGLQLHRTDLEGTVEIIVDRHGYRVRSHGAADPGSIGPWPFRPPSRPSGSWLSPAWRTGSSPTRAAWRGWRRRRRGRWRRPGSRSTSPWSRWPPCCTTSTSR